MSSGLHDLRFALRGLRHAPGYVVAFVLTLGLGIGANTAVFSAIYGVLLRPLPYRDGERLVYLRHAAQLAGVDNALFSVPEIQDYREQVGSFEGVAEFSTLTFTLLGLDEPRRVRAGIVSGNYFHVMGLDAALGRVLLPEDDGAAADPVMVLTDDAWHRIFGADPEVVGRTLSMNARTVTIVGVARPAPPYPERTDVYVNMVTSPHHLGATMNHDRLHRMTEVFARLAPGATVEAAATEVTELTARLHGEYPAAYDSTQGYEVSVRRLGDQLAERARPTMWVLLAAAAFVLIIACANVANLTLARTLRRQDELALRASLGASPWRLRRQLLIENLLPALGGAALGVLLAYAGVDLLVAFASRFSVRASEIRVDAGVLQLAFLAGVGAAGLFALLPTLPAAVQTRQGGGSAGRATGGIAARHLQRLLTVSQVAVCFVLLVGAGLLLRTLLNLQRTDPGVTLDEVLAMEIPLTGARMEEQERRRFYGTILERASALPGVRGAALGSRVPLRGMPTGLSAFLAALEFQIENRALEPGAPQPRADFRPVTPDYFRTLGIHLLQGRLFQQTDDADAPKVVVINQAMAERYFPAEDPIGKRLAWRGDVLRFIGLSDEWRTIVGVVSDAKDYGINQEVPHVLFQPFAQEPAAAVLFLRSAQPASLVEPARRIVRALDPDQPIESVATLAQVRSQSMAPERLNASLIGGFALLAVAIAAVGVGAVLAFSVSQRTREFGIRAALGADRQCLLRMVLNEGALLAAVGLLLGGLGSLPLSRLLSSLLYGIDPLDVPTFIAVSVVLLAVAVAASWAPASRASQVDPATALRAE